MSHSIAILIAHFGSWPAWINFFVESCRFNPDVDWIIFTDCGALKNQAPNVKVVDISFRDYKRHVSRALGIPFDPEDPYDICDIRPSFGFIHAEHIANHEFFGFGDLDVIYGKIRDHFDDELLGRYDAISNHPERVSGHLFIMRNCLEMVGAFKDVEGWQNIFSRSGYCGFDEIKFYHHLSKLYKARCLFRETYSTPVATSNMRWYWRKGFLSNEFYPHRGFPYLHFMHWRSPRWYSYHQHVLPGSMAPWERLENPIQLDWRSARKKGFMISPQGIGPILGPEYP